MIDPRILVDDQHVETALRVASLRFHGHLLFEVDESGWLSAQLWDLADLLEREVPE